MNDGRKDFLVSHAGSDRAWAEWVAWQLTEAGYLVELDVWGWAAGQDFITKISDALDHCDRVLALWSAEYFNPARYPAGVDGLAVINPLRLALAEMIIVANDPGDPVSWPGWAQLLSHILAIDRAVTDESR